MSFHDEPFLLCRPSPPTNHFDRRDRACVLIEEYRALYALLALRLTVVDQRVPLVGGVLLAVLSGLSALPVPSQAVLLVAMPIVLAWLLRLTVAHARSKEDVLRRIDEIERHVNLLAGEELLAFQSRHPNRRDTVAGRTGMGAVSSVLALCLAGVLGCVVLTMHQLHLPEPFAPLYVAYAGVATADLIYLALRVHRYRYEKGPVPAGPVSRVFKENTAL